ncbi:MAG: ABC transporter ATP-binding protein [Pseudoclavibacter sp.]|nr:ABC transporter ATP-binding protein [Pseudoclavibacter sp.]
MTVVLRFRDASVLRDRRPVLDGLDWTVREGERWAVLGPNGAGKSTVLNLAATLLHPTGGSVEVLGERLGGSDVFELRPRIGYAAGSLAGRIPAGERVRDAVLTAAYGVTGRWREQYEASDQAQADRVLQEWGLAELAERPIGTLSDGERKRVQIARAVMTDPELLLLDEPSASLDLGARELLLAALSEYAADPDAPTLVMVTHHVEEIPPGITHALLLRGGRAVAAGPVAESLDETLLSETFGLPLRLSRQDGRYSARAA